MTDYLEIARQALELYQAQAEAATQSVPADAEWPESLRELAQEVGQHTGNPEAAQREVWFSWCEWKAQALNRLFRDQGVTRQLGRITAAAVRHGERKAR